MKTNNSAEQLLSDIIAVAKLGGFELKEGEIQLDVLPAPHTPKGLPKGKMAIYVFRYEQTTFKVGKAGPKSSARFTSHHYKAGREPSTLAAALLNEKASNSLGQYSEENVGQWIKQNTERINFLVSSDYPVKLLALIETFLQCRLNPVFEGHKGQQ